MHTQKTSECAICQSIQPDKKSVIAKVTTEHETFSCTLFDAFFIGSEPERILLIGEELPLE